MRRLRVLLFPGITGEDRCFVETMALAVPGNATETIRYPGIAAASDVLMELPIAAHRIASRIAVTGRTVLIGYSYGGNLAFEVAHHLIARGDAVDLLILIDPALPDTAFSIFGDEPARAAAGPQAAPRTTLYALRPVRVLLTLVAVLLPSEMRRKLRRRILYELRVHARRAWTPTPIAARVLHVVSGQLAPAVSDGWARLCPRIRQVSVPGSHVGILRLPQRAAVADAILEALDILGERGAAASPRYTRSRG